MTTRSAPSRRPSRPARRRPGVVVLAVQDERSAAGRGEFGDPVRFVTQRLPMPWSIAGTPARNRVEEDCERVRAVRRSRPARGDGLARGIDRGESGRREQRLELLDQRAPLAADPGRARAHQHERGERVRLGDHRGPRDQPAEGVPDQVHRAGRASPRPRAPTACSSSGVYAAGSAGPGRLELAGQVDRRRARSRPRPAGRAAARSPPCCRCSRAGAAPAAPAAGTAAPRSAPARASRT